MGEDSRDFSDDSAPMKFRKKPVVIEALQLTADNLGAAADWICDLGGACDEYEDYLVVVTLEGRMRGDIGAWIIRDVQGEFYPCAPDIFAATYEEA